MRWERNVSLGLCLASWEVKKCLQFWSLIHYKIIWFSVFFGEEKNTLKEKVTPVQQFSKSFNGGPTPLGWRSSWWGPDYSPLPTWVGVLVLLCCPLPTGTVWLRPNCPGQWGSGGVNFYHSHPGPALGSAGPNSNSFHGAPAPRIFCWAKKQNKNKPTTTHKSFGILRHIL